MVLDAATDGNALSDSRVTEDVGAGDAGVGDAGVGDTVVGDVGVGDTSVGDTGDASIVMLPSGFAATGGGGQASSAAHRLSLTVGAPLMGHMSGENHRLRLGVGYVQAQ